MSIEDRRRAPRFAVSFKGTIATKDGHVCAIEVSNISSSGLQFLVAQAEIPHLIPNHSQLNSLTPVQIELICDLPLSKLANAQTSIRILCGIVYVKKISIDQCKVGCRFEQFYQQSELQLENHIRYCADFPILTAPTKAD